MTESVKIVTVDIIEGKPTHFELQNLLQLIAQELNIKTTSNYAKHTGKSFNGIKNHRAHILIDGIKFHSDKIEKNSFNF